MKSVSLVLAGGAARGLAHIGAIEELEDQDYFISSITGCSMGALVGGVYAAGRMNEFKRWLRSLEKGGRALTLFDFSPSFSHMMTGDKIINSLKEIIPDVRIEDMPIKFQAVATDWENGCEVVIDRGSLYEAVRASTSLPIVFSPVQHNGMTLVDGCVLNNFPLKQGRNMPGDLLVGVNVFGSPRGKETGDKDHGKDAGRQKKNNFMTMNLRWLDLMMQQIGNMSAELYPPDILVDIPYDKYESYDFMKLDEIAENGRLEMRKALGAKQVERKDDWKKILFLAYHGLHDDSEDTRRIKAQVKGLRLNGHEVHLCHFDLDERGRVSLFVNGKKMQDSNNSLTAGLRHRSDYSALLEYCRQYGIEMVYAHDAHNAGPRLTKFFHQLRQAGIKTATEIPPHPYDEADNALLKGHLGQWTDKQWRERLYGEMTAVVTFSDDKQLSAQLTIRITCPDETGSSSDGTTWRQEMQHVVDALMA